MIDFDFTVNVGHLLTIASVVAALVAAYFDIRRILGDHELRVRLSEEALSRQIETNTMIANALSLIRTDLAVIRVRAEKYEVAAEKVKDVVIEQVKKVDEIAKDQEKKK